MNIFKKSPEDYVLFYTQTNQSQYSNGGVSSCTLNALEATFQILSKQNLLHLNKKILDNILLVGCHYKPSTHRSFEEIFLSFSRYQKYTKVLVTKQFLTKQISQMVNYARQYSIRNNLNRCGIVITKPPETISVVLLNSKIELGEKEIKSVIFDSHRRKDHSGAAFIFFESDRKLVGYLKQLFPSIKFNDMDLMQYEMLNSLEVNLVSLTDDGENVKSTDVNYQLLKHEMRNTEGFVPSVKDFKNEILNEFPKKARKWIKVLNSENQLLFQQIANFNKIFEEQQKKNQQFQRELDLNQQMITEKNNLIQLLCKQIEKKEKKMRRKKEQVKKENQKEGNEKKKEVKKNKPQEKEKKGKENQEQKKAEKQKKEQEKGKKIEEEEDNDVDEKGDEEKQLKENEKKEETEQEIIEKEEKSKKEKKKDKDQNEDYKQN
ncbi:protein restricted tev movement [Anaeramoeba flamelloides]|uniref:Protein restricted tev movement n=1 Tax=Anaeramoeba flamelloides TaxID=1746091 RepID=A0AAV7ZE46_9EUKA|nr:protein restricted tev movement [Anaeramoeba flamelloides]